ncbi:FecR family protein [Fusibacter ferrireducens]|uniref:FecR domain-containing protein n=1 Tax=Fusibacter ferrireducens TaxID=2785058 RepID=A0ABR9ZVZ4_9FIRM|nr:FecR family protein [Fusibacter ferrireducens]MBF4694627.1 FecR domain-containing protein [Fusibacter ferrireducens]
MKRKAFAVTLVILIIFMGIPLDFAVKYKTASVVEVTGMVTILKAGGEKAFTPEVDTVLEHGDRIVTGKGASIALQIDTDKYIKVGEKTYMSLSELMSEAESGGDSTNIKLFTGKVWASLSKPLGGDDSFEIETPTAVMGAKGTKFFVKYVISPTEAQKEKSSTELVVLEGKVSMKTQVQKQGEGDEPAATQDVELLASANETLLLNPELVQGISDEITNRLNSGEAIEQINIQEVVSKVGKAKQIEVRDLDLFVLEIVADEPEAFEPNLTQDLEQIIEQKKQELPSEPEPDEGVNKIIYDELSDEDNAEPPKAPTTPNTPDNPNTSNTPSDDDNDKTDALTVTKVEIVDAVYDDGIADHIVVTFNQDVKDSTYSASSGAYIESSDLIGTLRTSSISRDQIPGVNDKVNDSILVFELNTTEKPVNTIPVAYLNIPHAGMIQSVSGASLGTVTNLSVVDKIAPVIVGSMISLEGAAGDKYVKIIYSEPITNDSLDLLGYVKIAANSETLYSAAQTIGYEKKSDDPFYVEAKKLDYPTVRYVKNAAIEGYEHICLKMNSEVPFYISDANGNQRLLQRDVPLLGLSMDTQKAMVSGVTVKTLTANKDYLFTVELNDYLYAEQLDSSVYMNQSLLKGTFSNSTTEFTDFQYLFGKTDQIKLVFHVTVFEGSLSDNDSVTIDYSYLYDLFGHAVTDYFDDAEQITRIYSYDSAEDTWAIGAPPAAPFYATSAATIDANSDGLVDHLQVTFNSPVDDSTFVASKGIVLQSENRLDPVDDSRIVTNLTGAYTDDQDDAVIYVKLDHSSSSIQYNTGALGLLTIPSGTFKSKEGALNNATESLLTIDRAAPVLVAGRYDFNGLRDAKSIWLVFSEPLAGNSLETPDFRILNNNTGQHSEAYPIAFGKMNQNVGYLGNEVKLEGLDSDTILHMIEYVTAEQSTFFYCSDGLTIEDASENQTVLTGQKIALTGSVVDTFKTAVKSVDVKDLGSNQYKISLIFDDYLSYDSATSYMGMLNEVVTYMDGYSNMSVVSNSYNASVSADISLSFVVQLEVPLLTTDHFSIDITGLYDYKNAQTWATNDNVDRTKFDIIYDSGWTFDAPYLSLLEANTLDFDSNGRVDYIELTFNKAVKDDTFKDVGAIVNSSSMSVATSAIKVLDGEESFNFPMDQPDDTKIYFEVAESVAGNTDAVGILDIPYAGMIESLTGLVLPATNAVQIKDKAKPVLMDLEIDLSLPLDEKYIALKFSEPLNESDTVDVSNLKLMSSGIYASNPIDLYGTTSVLGDQIFVKPLELGSVEDTTPSFISRLSKYLYDSNTPTGGSASIRLYSGFTISSANDEDYALPAEYEYPYGGPAASSIKRINETSAVSSITQVTSGSSVIVTLTYDDYLESWNHSASAYIPATVNVNTGNFGVMSQKVGSDHKSLEIELCSMPQNGDFIVISQVRNITNSYGDDANANANTTPIYAQAIAIRFDGTEWHSEPY